MRYNDELIEEIKDNNDIVEVVSQYITLKRSGRNFFGLCPFHKEKSPSFAVSPDKQIFHCFGCGVGGNVIHFIGKIENLNFKETLELLANRANIVLPILERKEDDKTIRLKSKIYEINQITAQFYHKNLYSPTSKIAQGYIKKRGLNNNILKAFLIGYAGNFDELYNLLKAKGYTEEELLASTLVKKTKDGKFIDSFRQRLIFPIQDVRNRVIAFGGRVLDNSKPKYINSPENIIYSKSKHLFGLNIAKKNDIKQIIIVEGYMDVISLHQRGITNVVSSLGTALTETQGRLLKRYSERIILGYDADGPGQIAILRGLEILQNMGCDVRILQINEAKDPDEYVVKYGSEKFQKCIDNAISLVEFKVKMLKKDLNLEITNDKIKFLNEIAKVLSKITNQMEREVYIEKISTNYQISKEAILAEINKLIYSNNLGAKILEKPVKPFITTIVKQNEISKAILNRENMVIYLLINETESSFDKLKSVINSEDFYDETNKKVLEKLYEEIKKGNINISQILNKTEDEKLINHMTEIMAYDFEITDVGKAIDDILIAYKKEKLIKKRNTLLEQIKLEQTNIEKTKQLEDELSDIVLKLAKMK